ncbi:MAG: hypothetical protein [Microviridae sp. ctzVR26]|nr:MAG: hypothetical protein [Microviridae sp. ctzVR26]
MKGVKMWHSANIHIIIMTQAPFLDVVNVIPVK